MLTEQSETAEAMPHPRVDVSELQACHGLADQCLALEQKIQSAPQDCGLRAGRMAKLNELRALFAQRTGIDPSQRRDVAFSSPKF